jgi:hypothetical protein
MYDRQHGLAANLFLAPGEGEAVEAEEGAPVAAAPPEPGPVRRLGLLDP